MKRYLFFGFLVVLIINELSLAQPLYDYSKPFIATSQLSFREQSPISLGENQPIAIAAMYSEDAEIDPWIVMFFFPKHSLKEMFFLNTAKQNGNGTLVRMVKN